MIKVEANIIIGDERIDMAFRFCNWNRLDKFMQELTRKMNKQKFISLGQGADAYTILTETIKRIDWKVEDIG